MIPNSMRGITVSFCWVCVAASDTNRAATAVEPSASKPATTAERLRADLGSFQLSLMYEGEYEGPTPSLRLSTSPNPRGIDTRLTYLPIVRISRDQARRIIEHLDSKGVIDAENVQTTKHPSQFARVGRRYVVTLCVNPATGLVRIDRDLGWGQDLVEWVGQLKALLEGEASRKLSQLEEDLGKRVAAESRALASEPVEVDGLEFRALGEPIWVAPAAGAKTHVELALQVTNRSQQTLRLNRFDTIRIEMKDDQGRRLTLNGGRDGTIVPPPLVLRPSESQIIPRRGTLERDQAGNMHISGIDGTRMYWSFADIRPGRYTLAFVCHNNRAGSENIERMGRDRIQDMPAHEQKTFRYWEGNVTTNELSIRVNEAARD